MTTRKRGWDVIVGTTSKQMSLLKKKTSASVFFVLSSNKCQPNHHPGPKRKFATFKLIKIREKALEHS